MEASTRLNKNPLSKFNPLWIWLSIEAVLLCAILFANSVLCMLAVKLHAQYFMGQPMPWLSRVVFNHIPYDFRSILAGGILILSTFIALGFASGKKIKSAAALHLPISFTLGCVLLLYTVLIASVLPYLEFRCGLTPEDYISPIPQPAVSPWIWIVSSVLYACFVIYFARKYQKRFKTDLPPFS